MKKGDSVFKIIISVAILISIAVIGFYFFNFNGAVTLKQEVWGQFGDYLGGTLNPVFGFLSLIILLYVLRQNERALKMPKKELKLTRKELKNSATALAEQSETLKIQRFEQTFFSLLKLYDEIVAEFRYNSSNGRIALRERFGFPEFLEKNKYVSKKHTKIIIRIIEFLDNANINNKLLYSGLLRDSFVNEELILLCREIIQIPEYEKIFKLLYKYGVFENFDFNNFPRLEQLRASLDEL
ncbi:MAG: hypothetical protein PHE67_12545 [Campylobacterales bacterium]|nr:hypothetical protein [Campylobacterales bacterium]